MEFLPRQPHAYITEKPSVIKHCVMELNDLLELNHLIDLKLTKLITER